MDGYRRLFSLLLLVGLTAASGASCPQMVQRYTMPRPRALPPSPTLDQVIAVVNGNSSQIRSFVSNFATITVPEAPTLRASVAMERPHRLRLRAETTLTGPEVDVGSNDELFWFWFRRDPQHAEYFCRHDQFARSNARRMVPIAPADLADALGLVEFDPALPHQGPVTRPDGRLEVRTIRETDLGPSTRVTVIDPVTGWVLEQQTFDASGQLVLSVERFWSMLLLIYFVQRVLPTLSTSCPAASNVCCSRTQPVTGSMTVTRVEGPRSVSRIVRTSSRPSDASPAPGAATPDRTPPVPTPRPGPSARWAHLPGVARANWSCRQKYTACCGSRRIQNQNSSSLLPRSTSGPVSVVSARSRNRCGRSIASSREASEPRAP